MHDIKRRLTAEDYHPLKKSKDALGAFAASVGIYPPLRIEGPDRNGYMVLWGKSEPAQKTASKTKAKVFDLSALDGNVKSVLSAIDGLPKDHLKALLEAEQDGKTRKTVVEALEKALAAD
ncbi:MAG: hypothetical protein RIA64_01420 [Rhodospirillales bacterium]